MRTVVTGLNAQGRSCIVQDGDVSPKAVEGRVGAASSTLWGTLMSPPPVAPPQAGSLLSTGLAPGELRWTVTQLGPEAEVDMHHHLDYKLAFVLDGSMRLVLDEGDTVVATGECFVLPGVDHMTEVGPDGCRMLLIALGVSPPA